MIKNKAFKAFVFLLLLSSTLNVNSLDRFSVRRIKNVFLNAENIDKKESKGIVYYRIAGKDKNLLGYAFFEEERGYEGPVKCMICLDSFKKIKKVIVYEAKNETPEYTTKCLKQSWLDQFIGHDADNVPYNKYEFGDYDIDEVSGATITSAAILGCIIKSVETEIKGE